MVALLGELSRNLLVIIFINVLLEMLMPQGQYHRYIRMVTGLIVVLMVVSTMSLIFGRAPASDALLPYTPPGPLQLDTSSIGVSRVTREQALTLYRESLQQLAREEVEAGGKWKLVSAHFALEEDANAELYGAIHSAELQVQAAGSASNDIEPVQVDSVNCANGVPEAEERPEAARLPQLEQALARRFQVPQEVIRVYAE